MEDEIEGLSTYKVVLVYLHVLLIDELDNGNWCGLWVFIVIVLMMSEDGDDCNLVYSFHGSRDIVNASQEMFHLIYIIAPHDFT